MEAEPISEDLSNDLFPKLKWLLWLVGAGLIMAGDILFKKSR